MHVGAAPEAPRSHCRLVLSESTTASPAIPVRAVQAVPATNLGQALHAPHQRQGRPVHQDAAGGVGLVVLPVLVLCLRQTLKEAHPDDVVLESGQFLPDLEGPPPRG
jgi:hypothetical protein